jgi:hypothetical protein
MEFFGKPNMAKQGRLSWSGEPCPKITGFNSFGQRLFVDSENNIFAVYSFSNDARSHKSTLLPAAFQKESLILAKWNKESISRKLERKFNQNGWFKCIKNSSGIYTSIVFGKPISYENWILLVQEGTVFFDSGMYQGNFRPYSQWRANNSLWDRLVVETY